MSPGQGSDSLLRVVLVVLAVVLIAPFLMMLLAMPMVGMMGWGGGMRAAPLWGVGTMVVALLVVFGIGYLLYRSVADTSRAEDRALEELRVAYARGELSDEEYERRRERLRDEN